MQEAREAIDGGADIVDVKNPREGSLGASFPWVIKQVRAAAPKEIEVSCTLGDVPNLPGTAALAALGAATTGVNYVKASLLSLKTFKDAVYLMQNVAKAVKGFDSSIKVVAVGFADADRVGSVSPILIPKIARDSGCDVAMLDTSVKDDKSLLHFLTVKQLRNYVVEAHSYGLKTALAGSLKKQDLPTVSDIGADIVGLRGAACTNGDRKTGSITKGKVEELVQLVRKTEKRQVTTGL